MDQRLTEVVLDTHAITAARRWLADDRAPRLLVLEGPKDADKTTVRRRGRGRPQRRRSALARPWRPAPQPAGAAEGRRSGRRLVRPLLALLPGDRLTTVGVDFGRSASGDLTVTALPRFRRAFEEHQILVPRDDGVRDDLMLSRLNKNGVPHLPTSTPATGRRRSPATVTSRSPCCWRTAGTTRPRRR